MRGTDANGIRRLVPNRFIPARAGNGVIRPPQSGSCPVHPRACGERALPAFVTATVSGSSPRVRGTVHQDVVPPDHARFIPARAGNGAGGTPARTSRTVHPRACGERGREVGLDQEIAGSSPRVRGTASPLDEYNVPGRFIPARAGNGRSGIGRSQAHAVHPRACGERRPGETAPTVAAGSSPRVRGTDFL